MLTHKLESARGL